MQRKETRFSVVNELNEISLNLGLHNSQSNELMENTKADLNFQQTEIARNIIKEIYYENSVYHFMKS